MTVYLSPVITVLSGRIRARTLALLAKEYDMVWRQKALLWRCAKVPNSEIFTLLMKVGYL